MTIRNFSAIDWKRGGNSRSTARAAGNLQSPSECLDPVLQAKQAGCLYRRGLKTATVICNADGQCVVRSMDAHYRSRGSGVFKYVGERLTRDEIARRLYSFRVALKSNRCIGLDDDVDWKSVHSGAKGGNDSPVRKDGRMDSRGKLT